MKFFKSVRTAIALCVVTCFVYAQHDVVIQQDEHSSKAPDSLILISDIGANKQADETASLQQKEQGTKLPDGFVYLSDVDPSIIQSMRYCSTENFVGRVLPGYKKPRAILTKRAAEALSKVQKELLKEDYSLVVYEAYRPQKAVDLFIVWANDVADQKMKAQYYPNIDKRRVFELGYVGVKSGHSRGSTVDLTIIKVGQKIKTPEFSVRKIGGRDIPFLDDGTVDMGSSFDFFGEESHDNSPLIPEPYAGRRVYLREKMMKYFKIFPEEWWHFTLKDESFPATYFDFDVA